jgi:multidrug efflux pump subunit AcrA (membrane-fusion protein)
MSATMSCTDRCWPSSIRRADRRAGLGQGGRRLGRSAGAADVGAFARQKDLLGRGNTTRRDYDQAEADLRSAQAQLSQAQSDLKLAEDQLSYTELARRGRRHHHLAESRGRPGRGPGPDDLRPGARRARDAVFNVHEWALNNAMTDKDLAIALVLESAVKTVGDVREIAPAFNPDTETVRVKVACARRRRHVARRPGQRHGAR